MTKADMTPAYTGRARIALVFGEHETAVISWVVARVCGPGSDKRIRFKGPASFDKQTAHHIQQVVLPIADRILAALGISQNCFEISVVNIDAASAHGIGVKVSGFSIDVSVLLAILSASLKLPIPEEIVATGHIASADGDLRMVDRVSCKVAAAVQCGTVTTFLYPCLDLDNSLDCLSPAAKEQIIEALGRAQKNLGLISVKDISELIEAVFSNSEIVLTSLRCGFFDGTIDSPSTENPCKRAAAFFIENNEQRFWVTLEEHMFDGRFGQVKELLAALSRFHIDRRIYPSGLGAALVRLLLSLPAAIRHHTDELPVISVADCINIVRFADDCDHEDVLQLFRAASGDGLVRQQGFGSDELSFGRPDDNNRPAGPLQFIMSQISSDNLSRIGQTADSARAGFVIESILAEHNELIDCAAAFYINLLRHASKLSEVVDIDAASADAVALLEEAFAGRGGFQAAVVEARTGSEGGLRFILDRMTDQYKMQEQRKHVKQVLKMALDPLDWDGKVSLIADLKQYLKPCLSPDLLSEPDEKLASSYELVVEEIVKFMDKIKSLFKSL